MMANDLTLLSSTFPELADPQVLRDNLIGLLKDRFGPERKIIVVYGPAGSGKTTLLAQFAKSYAANSLTFFVGTTLLTSDPRYFLLDMCEQIGRALGRQTGGIGKLRTDELRQLFQDFYRGLVQTARRQKQTYYFVVDGLEWSDLESRERSILRLLPTEPGSNIRLLLTATPAWTPDFAHDRWDIPFFSMRDTEAYFATSGIQPSVVRKIHQRCQGMPGYLAAIRRVVASGTDLQTLFDSLPDALRGMFEVEWNRASIHDESLPGALGILAFADEPLSSGSLAEITGTDKELLERDLRTISFLQRSPSDATISFVSDAYKLFAREMLRTRRESCEDLLVQFYSRDPYTNSSLLLLPTYLAKPTSYLKLRELVTSEYLLRSLDVTRDTFLLRRTLRLASEQAYQADDWPSVQRFTLASSILRTVSTEAAHDDEVEALLVLGDHGTALETAYQAILPEDRLDLLARVAHHMHRNGAAVPQQVIADLEQMADAINAPSLADRAVDIAATLFDLLPERALHLVDRSVGGDSGSRSLDIARASLAIRLQRDPKDLVKSGISDVFLRDFASAYSPRIANLTANEVLAEIENASSTSAKLFIVTSWCNENRQQPSAAAVVEKGLEAITNDPSYGVSMRLLRQLAEALRSAPEDAIGKLIDRLDLLKKTAVKRPVEEALRLELLLAVLHARRSRDESVNRILELYLQLDAVSDIDARCEGIARVLLALHEVDPDDKQNLRREFEVRLGQEYDALLSASAEQFDISQQMLRAVTRYNPNIAIDFASRLNTQDRRDQAFVEILKNIIRPDIPIALSTLRDLLARVTNAERRDVALVDSIRRLAGLKLFETQPEMRSIVEDVKSLIDPQDRCVAYAHVISSLASNETIQYKTDLAAHLTSSLDQVDELWQLVNLSFSLSRTVAKTHPDLARSLFSRAKEETSKTSLATKSFAQIYFDCLLLAIRATTGLLHSGADADLSKRRILAAVSLLPSHGYQARLLSDLAIRFATAGKIDLSRQITREEVIPRLDNCRNKYSQAQTLANVCSCLYDYDPHWTMEQLRQLGPPYHDRAVNNLVRYLLSGKPLADTVSLEALRVNLEAPQARRATEVINEFAVDVQFYGALTALVRALIQRDPNNPDREICRSLVERDVLDVASRLKKAISSKLPDQHNIQHQGYAIAARAAVHRLEIAASWRAKFESEWSAIVDEARTIPNLADRVYVLTLIAENMPPADADFARALLRDAETLVPQIPNPLDRADRMHLIAKAWKSREGEQSIRSMLRKAMEATVGLNWNHSREELTEQVLELANDVDPEFAASLVPLIDNPVVAHGYRLGLVSHRLEKNPRKFDNLGVETELEDLQRAMASAASSMTRSLNSGTGQVRHPREIGAWLLKAQDGEFETYYPVSVWALQNNLIHSKQPEVLMSMFESFYDTVSISLTVGQRLVGIRASSLPVIAGTLPETVKLFKAGTRPQALVTLKEWLHDNAKTYLKVCDPYFRPSDLDLLLEIDPECRVFIVTSWKGLGLTAGDRGVEQLFGVAWKTLSKQAPPWVQMHVVGTRSGDTPLHSRYIITDTAGLAIGTSMGGFGHKDSDIRLLGPDEAARIEAEFVDPFLSAQWALFKGESLTMHVFML